MSIGERIRTLRQEKNLSQGQLAQQLSVTRQAVSKWEQDLSSPDTLNLVKLADALDTEVEYLATGKKPVYLPAPLVVNLENKVDRIVERVVEKPVIKKVVRIRYRNNPVSILLAGILGFALGLALGIWL